MPIGHSISASFVFLRFINQLLKQIASCPVSLRRRVVARRTSRSRLRLFGRPCVSVGRRHLPGRWRHLPGRWRPRSVAGGASGGRHGVRERVHVRARRLELGLGLVAVPGDGQDVRVSGADLFLPRRSGSDRRRRRRRSRVRARGVGYDRSHGGRPSCTRRVCRLLDVLPEPPHLVLHELLRRAGRQKLAGVRFGTTLAQHVRNRVLRMRIRVCVNDRKFPGGDVEGGPIVTGHATCRLRLHDGLTVLGVGRVPVRLAPVGRRWAAEDVSRHVCLCVLTLLLRLCSQ